MDWLRLTIISYAECIGELSELLENFGAFSLSYLPHRGEALFADGRPQATYWEQTAVVALFDAQTDLDILLACVRNRIGTDRIIGQRIEAVADREWTEAHKSQQGVLLFGGRLGICPSWCTAPADMPYVLTLDPGLAFGTGAHATTALCLEWLAQAQLRQQWVIDYGCGSGILGLAAARLGAERVFAVDIDPQALTATRVNAERNRLLERIRISIPEDMPAGEADVLLANILLHPLLGLAGNFANLVRPGGHLVLSGILSVQAEECLAAYAPWFMMDEPVFKDEWALLHGVRTG